MIRVAGIENRRLHQRGPAGVQKKGEVPVDEPDATACYLRDGEGGCVTGRAEGDGAVLLQCRADGFYFGGEVEVFSVGGEEASLVGVLECEARLFLVGG